MERILIAFNFITGYPEDVEPPSDYTPVLPYFVVPAATIALASLVLVGIAHVTMSDVSAGLVSSLVVAGLWAYVSRGQNLNAFGSLVVALRDHFTSGRRESIPGETLHQVSVFAAVMVKLAILAVLISRLSTSHTYIYLLLPPLCSVLYSVEMSIHLGFFPRKHEMFTSSHAIAVVIFFAVAFLAGNLRCLFIIIFIWLLCFFVGKWADGRISDRQEELINGGAEATELIVLLIGLVFM